MKTKLSIVLITGILLAGCTSSEKLTYLNNLPDTSETQYFPMDIPDYKIQYRDILYVTVKAMTPDGSIEDMLLGRASYNQSSYIRDESSQYIIGYNVDEEGNVFLPVIGKVRVADHTIPEIREILQAETNKYFKNTFVECKFLSFKYTVLGEAMSPGTYVNYNNYLTVLEAIGRAGGVGDFGRRDRVLVVRPTKEGTKTYRINLQDKNLLSSEAYFLMPNDLVIIEPVKHKIFNMNLPTFSFILASITTTLLLINFFGSN